MEDKNMPATSLLVTNQQMRQEQEQGRVRVLHPDLPEFCRWYGAWWIRSPDPAGWLRVTDDHLRRLLDQIKTRLDIAEDNLACDRARRPVAPPTPPGTAPEDHWPG
jgi:hypothetical protein